MSKGLLVIQARMGSKRLPGKMMLDVNGMPAIVFLLKRLAVGYEKENIIVATTHNSIDDVLCQVVNDFGVRCYRGDENDVLSRFIFIAEKNNDYEYIIRLTGDNILIDLNLVREVELSHTADFDITSTRFVSEEEIERFTPKGQSVDVISIKSLIGMSQNRYSVYCHEHVIPIFFNDPFKFNLVRSVKVNGPSISMDTKEDYQKLLAFLRNI